MEENRFHVSVRTRLFYGQQKPGQVGRARFMHRGTYAVRALRSEDGRQQTVGRGILSVVAGS